VAQLFIEGKKEREKRCQPVANKRATSEKGRILTVLGKRSRIVVETSRLGTELEKGGESQPTQQEGRKRENLHLLSRKRDRHAWPGLGGGASQGIWEEGLVRFLTRGPGEKGL